MDAALEKPVFLGFFTFLVLYYYLTNNVTSSLCHAATSTCFCAIGVLKKCWVLPQIWRTLTIIIILIEKEKN